MRTLAFVVIGIGVVIGAVMPAPRKPVAAPPPPVAGVAAAASAPAEAPRETVLERTAAGHFLAVADVNRMPVRFVVDTGADMVALTLEDAERAGVPFDRGDFEIVGQGAGGPVRGQSVTINEITLEGKRVTGVRAVVLEGADVSLLGHSYLRELASVNIQGDEMRLR